MCFTDKFAYRCGKKEYAKTEFCEDALWFHIPYRGWFQNPCGDHRILPVYSVQRCFRCYLTGSHDESDDDEPPMYYAYPDAYHPRPGFDPDFDMASEHGAFSVQSDDEDPAPAGYCVLPEEPADLDADANANAEADDSDSLYDSDAENDASAAPGYDPTQGYDPSLPDTESDYDAAAAPTYVQGYLPAPHLLANIQARLEARRAEELTDEEYREQEELADEEYNSDHDMEYDSDQYP